MLKTTSTSGSSQNGASGRESQREQALARANRHRSARARLKRLLPENPALAVHVLAELPPYVRTAPVERFLLWIPKVGPRKASLILGAIDPETPLDRLSAAERRELLARVEVEVRRQIAS